MTGLVLEGGTFRAIFSAGVMDAFIDENIFFPYTVGVSAGISNAASYISMQSERNIKVLERYRNDWRYLSALNFLTDGNVFGMDFVFDRIPNILVPFDYDTFHSFKGRFVVGVTNAETGKSEFFDGLKDSDKWEYLRAACAIPVAFKEQYINGTPYYDGGLSEPICINKAIKDGCDKNVIILTQPEGFVKRLTFGYAVTAELAGIKYPEIKRAILLRHKLYNNRVKFCEKLEKEGKAIIIRPDRALKSFEKDERVLRANYNHGYIKGRKYADMIRKFMDN